MREIAEILHGNFAEMGYSIPTSEAKYCLVKFIGWFRADAKKIAQLWNKEIKCDNTRSIEVLGITYRPIEESLKEMGESLMIQGQIRDRRPK